MIRKYTAGEISDYENRLVENFKKMLNDANNTDPLLFFFAADTHRRTQTNI